MTSARGQSRYSFTAQYVAGASILARRAAEIERSAAPDRVAVGEQRAVDVGAVMQAFSALEAELAELLAHGPGHHLGSNGIDETARAFITEPVAKLIDGMSGVLGKYEILLHLLGKLAFEKGHYPYQDADMLVAFRNQLVHYKSKWDDGTRLSSQAISKKFPLAPPAIAAPGSAFPLPLLSAGCAHWASKTAADFIDEVYSKLGITERPQ